MERGFWTISYIDVKPSETSLDHIGELVKQGFTSGEILEFDNKEED